MLFEVEDDYRKSALENEIILITKKSFVAGPKNGLQHNRFNSRFDSPVHSDSVGVNVKELVE